MTPDIDKINVQRSIAVIFVALTSVGMGQMVVFALLPSLGRELGWMEFQVGLVITSSAVVYSLCSFMWGKKSDHWGRKRVMLCGLVGYTIGTVVFASVFYLGFQGWLSGLLLYVALILVRMGQSAVMSATGPAATAYVADITDADNRTSGMAKLGAAHNIGAVLGPTLALLTVISLLAPLYAAALVTLFAAILVAFLLPDYPVNKAPSVALPRKPFWQVSIDKRYGPFIMIGVIMFMSYAVVQQTLGFYFADRLVIDNREAAQVTGIALMCGAVMSLIAQGVVVQYFKWSPKRLIRSGLPLMCIGFLILPTASDAIVMFMAMGFLGFGMGLTAPGFTAAASLSVGPEDQGQVAGAIGACPAIGFILGPIIGTSLYQLNAEFPYWFSAIMFVPLYLYAIKITSKLES